jgi:hypothetical protein
LHRGGCRHWRWQTRRRRQHHHSGCHHSHTHSAPVSCHTQSRSYSQPSLQYNSDDPLHLRSYHAQFTTVSCDGNVECHTSDPHHHQRWSCRLFQFKQHFKTMTSNEKRKALTTSNESGKSKHFKHHNNHCHRSTANPSVASNLSQDDPQSMYRTRSNELNDKTSDGCHIGCSSCRNRSKKRLRMLKLFKSEVQVR